MQDFAAVSDSVDSLRLKTLWYACGDSLKEKLKQYFITESCSTEFTLNACTQTT